MIADPLRLQPGQKVLTTAQAAEARRFTEERIAAQFSTDLGDETVAEALVKQRVGAISSHDGSKMCQNRYRFHQDCAVLAT